MNFMIKLLSSIVESVCTSTTLDMINDLSGAFFGLSLGILRYPGILELTNKSKGEESGNDIIT